jgi:hypothetical protein
VLAPVLARLDELPGVARARAESAGRHFALELVPGADAASVALAAREALAGRARVLGPEEAASQLAARPRGDPWLSRDEVMALSYVEGRILAVRVSARTGREAGLAPEARERLAEALRIEIFAVLERVHAEGGRSSSRWFYEEWPAVAGRVFARGSAFVPGDLLPALRSSLDRALDDAEDR